MTNPNQTNYTDGQHTEQALHFHKPPAAVRILLLILTVLGAVISGICPDLLSASVFGALTAGCFSYCYLLTFSSLMLCAVPAVSAIATYLLTWSFYHALQALLFLPLAVAVLLCLLRLKNKTSTVLSGALAIGIALLVLFLIAYMMQNGTVSPDALKQSYNAFFEDMRTQMTDSMLDAYEVMESAAQNTAQTPDLSHPVIDSAETASVTEALPDAGTAEKQKAATEAYIRSMVDLSVNSVKLASPALFAIAAQVLSYLSLGIYGFLVRVCHTPYLLPHNYRITVSRTAAVIFVIAYLINMFPMGSSTSLTQIASANLATMMMPGIFLMGLNSLVRRAKDPLRRRSFILTAVVIGFLVLVYPSYAIFFVLIDGIGEVFFGGRSIF